MNWLSLAISIFATILITLACCELTPDTTTAESPTDEDRGYFIEETTETYKPQRNYNDLNEQPECATTVWSDWSDCSEQCKQYRTREYIDPDAAKLVKCSNSLLHIEDCNRDQCDYLYNMKCALTAWSEWSPCMRRRTRQYLNRRTEEECQQIKHMVLIDHYSCDDEINVSNGKNNEEHDYTENEYKSFEDGAAAAIETSENGDNEPPECSTTAWSGWDECSTECGPGKQFRTREFKNPTLAKRSKCRASLRGEHDCTGTQCNSFDEGAAVVMRFCRKLFMYISSGI